MATDQYRCYYAIARVKCYIQTASLQDRDDVPVEVRFLGGSHLVHAEVSFEGVHGDNTSYETDVPAVEYGAHAGGEGEEVRIAVLADVGCGGLRHDGRRGTVNELGLLIYSTDGGWRALDWGQLLH